MSFAGRLAYGLLQGASDYFGEVAEQQDYERRKAATANAAAMRELALRQLRSGGVNGAAGEQGEPASPPPRSGAIRAEVADEPLAGQLAFAGPNALVHEAVHAPEPEPAPIAATLVPVDEAGQIASDVLAYWAERPAAGLVAADPRLPLQDRSDQGVAAARQALEPTVLLAPGGLSKPRQDLDAPPRRSRPANRPPEPLARAVEPRSVPRPDPVPDAPPPPPPSPPPKGWQNQYADPRWRGKLARLSREEEVQFRAWTIRNQVPLSDDYDMRAFWKSGGRRIESRDVVDRLPDKFKTPLSETFSEDSIYADPARRPPRWNDRDQLVAADGRVLYDSRAAERQQAEAPARAAAAIADMTGRLRELGMAPVYNREVPRPDANLRSGGEVKGPYEPPIVNDNGGKFVTHTSPALVAGTNRLFAGGASDAVMLKYWVDNGLLDPDPSAAPAQWAAAAAQLRTARAAVRRHTFGGWRPGDVAARAEPPPQLPGQTDEEYVIEITGGNRPDRPTLSADPPDWSERIGHGIGRLIGGDTRQGARQGRRFENFLRDVTPVGAIDYYNEYSARQDRALNEGRIVDALGNEIGKGVAILSVLPIGRAPAKAGRYVIDQAVLRAAAAGADGAVDASRAGQLLRNAADDALARGGTVTIHTGRGPRRIVGPGMVDEAGEAWDPGHVLRGGGRVEIDLPNGAAGRAPGEPRGIELGAPLADDSDEAIRAVAGGRRGTRGGGSGSDGAPDPGRSASTRGNAGTPAESGTSGSSAPVRAGVSSETARIEREVDALRERAAPGQARINDFGRRYFSENFLEAKVKERDRIIEKVARGTYRSADDLKDVARGGILVDTMAEAEAAAARIRQHFEVVQDKGWVTIPQKGYRDRKIIVRLDNGILGEFQILPRGVAAAKKQGADELYRVERSSTNEAEIAELQRRQREMFDSALEGTPFASSSSSARSASGNSLANASRESGAPAPEAQPTIPGAQFQPRSSQTQATPSPANQTTATPRSSRSNNSILTTSDTSTDRLGSSNRGNKRGESASAGPENLPPFPDLKVGRRSLVINGLSGKTGERFQEMLPGNVPLLRRSDGALIISRKHEVEARAAFDAALHSALDSEAVRITSGAAPRSGAGAALASIEPKRAAANMGEAREAAKAFLGRALVNRWDGLRATVSGKSLKKMMSGKALHQSSSAADHAWAVANVDELFPIARRVETKPDGKGSPDLAGIHRYVALMVSGDRVLKVKITVKETISPRQPNKLYTVETIKVE